MLGAGIELGADSVEFMRWLPIVFLPLPPESGMQSDSEQRGIGKAPMPPLTGQENPEPAGIPR